MNKPNGVMVKSSLERGMLKFAIASCMTLCSAWASAQNAIQSLTAGTQGGAEIIRIETTEPLAAVPTGFTIQSPARIALDFPGVVNAIGRLSLIHI